MIVFDDKEQELPLFIHDYINDKRLSNTLIEEDVTEINEFEKSIRDNLKMLETSNILDNSMSRVNRSTFYRDDASISTYSIRKTGASSMRPSQAPSKEENIPTSLKPLYGNKKDILHVKRSDEIRKEYYSKLIQKSKWKPLDQRARSNNIVILDWDDTLLCTNYLTKLNILAPITKDTKKKLSKKDKKLLLRLEERVCKILSYSIEKANTFIVTNAEPGWVEFSAKIFFPKSLIYFNDIKIISARGEYEKRYPLEQSKWKLFTFIDIIKKFDYRLITNIICMGDSYYEIEAGKNLSIFFLYCVIKTIKINLSPNIFDLILQLDLVTQQLEYIFNSATNYQINLTKNLERTG